MANLKALVFVWVAFAVAGCATSPVLKGTIIGAASGAALGAGTGVLVSDEDLLGSSTAPETGNLSLHSGPTILAGTLVGAVFGSLVGAMVGHAHDDGDEGLPIVPAAGTAQAPEVETRPIAF